MDAKVNAAIIGAGPSGIAAGIFLQRAGLEPLLFERVEPGGLLRSANLVENYPGFPRGISGEALVKKFASQLKRAGPDITHAQVRRVTRAAGAFRIETDASACFSRSLIVATGTRPADVRLDGARALKGELLFTEITDVPRTMRKGKRALILGGGDAAFDYALNLVASGDDVTIFSRSEPHCLPLLRERAEKTGVTLRIGSDLKSVSHSAKGAVECIVRDSSERVDADFVLLACGRIQNIDFLDPTLRRTVGTRAPPETSVPGFYLAGDVARGNHRQTGIAVGDGILAAMLTQDFLRQREGGR